MPGYLGTERSFNERFSKLLSCRDEKEETDEAGKAITFVLSHETEVRFPSSCSGAGSLAAS